MSLVTRGQVERGLAMLVESQEQSEALGLPHDACRADAAFGNSLLWLERYAEARSSYEHLLAYARKVQAEMFEGVAVELEREPVAERVPACHFYQAGRDGVWESKGS